MFSSYTIIAKPDYVITKGNYGIFDIRKGEDALFTSNADFDKFVCVKVDGSIVNALNHAAASGSINITLKASYLKKLSNGIHTIEIVSSDGSAKTSFVIIGSTSFNPKPRYIIPNTSVR